MAGAVGALLVLGALTCGAGLAAPAPSAQVEGAANLLATTGGVVWSFANNFEHGPQVLRSTDAGVKWESVLKVPYLPNGFGLTASYFLGGNDAWTVKQNLHGDGVGETTTVYGTADGGTHWWHTKALPGDLTKCCVVPFDQNLLRQPRGRLGIGSGPGH